MEVLHVHLSGRSFLCWWWQEDIRKEAQMMARLSHPNLVSAFCSFAHSHFLWVVMPYMAGGSCMSIMKSHHPDGFEEPVIATILLDTLKALDYLHHHGHIHRDVKVSGEEGRGV